jgi:hypothetical protein
MNPGAKSNPPSSIGDYFIDIERAVLYKPREGPTESSVFHKGIPYEENFSPGSNAFLSTIVADG